VRNWCLLAGAALAAGPSLAAAPHPALGEIVKSMVVQHVPLVVEERKGWGDQVHVFDGLKFSGKGLKVKADVRKKAVNHGLWRHYRVSCVEPERDLSIEFPRLEYVEGTGVVFVVLVHARLRGYADFKQYNNGVKLFSAATEGDVDLTARIEGTIAVRFVPNGLWSEVHLTPKVEAVSLDLPNIDVERFGKIRGDWARETGDGFRRMIERRLHKKEPSLTAKINRAIQKELDQGSLKLSLQEFLGTKRAG
jgi:hypothetical protein